MYSKGRTMFVLIINIINYTEGGEGVLAISAL